MDPSSSENTGIQLPAPEQSPDFSGDGGVEAGPAELTSPEQAPAGAEKAPATGKTAPLAGMPPITLPVPPQTVPAAPTDDASATTALPASTVVDDGDLIEKEWVNKAKKIVEKNRNDPYKQSEELTVFRADYMKKRYDKNIKLK